MDRKTYVAHIQKELGLDQRSGGRVICIDVDEEESQFFQEWYEEELIKLYERMKTDKERFDEAFV